ncbi:MAG TPA: PEP-CTERM sorting domain-containing protein [Pyrinomonadaceae bacterium]
MHRSPLKVFLPLLLFVMLSAADARADAVVITSGSITFANNSVDNNFSISGNGLSMHGRTGFMYVGFTFVDTNFQPTISLGRFYDNDDFTVALPFTLGGDQYSAWNNLDDHIALSITAAAFSFPVDPSVTSVTFTSVFTLSGSVGVRYPADGSLTGQTTNITGEGLATAVYVRDGNFPNIWLLQNLNYTFNSTPTPEPAALLLLFTGLGGVATKVYRRRRAGGGQ